MKISVSELTTNRKWRSSTGLDLLRFEKLLVEFRKIYCEIYKQTFGEHLPKEAGNDGVLIHPKKSHTVKTLLIINQEKKIEYLSHYYCGAMHDYRILKEGFLGIAKNYLCKVLSIPHKKSIKKELTSEQK